MLKVTLSLAAAAAAVFAAAPAAVPHQPVPAGRNASLITFATSRAVPRPGHTFAAATFTVTPDALDRVRIFGIRCALALDGRLVSTRVQKLRLGPRVIGGVCRAAIPRGTSGAILAFAGGSSDGFSVGIGRRGSQAATRTISHFRGVWRIAAPSSRTHLAQSAPR